jgi:hypothetical protein
MALMAQKLNKADKQLIEKLKGHIEFLASDALEGRRAGTAGEQKAVDYIIEQYKGLGILPMGTNGYMQNFSIDEGKRFASNAVIKVNNQSAIPQTDFFALSNSGSNAFTSRAARALNEVNQVWFKDVHEVLEENTSNPHFDMNEWISTTATQLKNKGAVALFLYNSGTLVDNIQFNKYDPVVYFTKQGFTKLFSDELATYSIEANVQFEHPTRTAHNVVGLIDNKATHTVILGAHLDHLGYNEDKNGLDLNTLIHNGADDNASGTAALIEVAKSLLKKAPKNNNYLIIHFSGEELGLLGSKYWLDHPTYKGSFNYMINMDMVGRYDTARKLTVGGFGTSSKWAEILSKTPTPLFTHYDSAGTIRIIIKQRMTGIKLITKEKKTLCVWCKTLSRIRTVTAN